MAKPAKANTPQPYPPVQRKPSQNGVNGKKQTQTPTTKFYVSDQCDERGVLS